MKLRTKLTTGTITVHDVEIDIQQLTPKDIKDLRKKHTRYVGKVGSAVPEIDEIAFGLDLFKKQIVDWRNAFDDNGPLECNERNKELIYNYDQSFVSDVIEAMREFFESREDEERKN